MSEIYWFVLDDRVIVVAKNAFEYPGVRAEKYEIDLVNHTLTIVFEGGRTEKYRLLQFGQRIIYGVVKWYAEVEPL